MKKQILCCVLILISYLCTSQDVKNKVCNSKLYFIQDSIEQKNDNYYIQVFKPDIPIKFIGYMRENEYFENKDTCFRDYFIVSDVFLTVDSLIGCRQKDYTVSFNIIKSIFLETNDRFFLIIFGVNAFFMGTDQNDEFIIFSSLKDGKWFFYDSYERIIPNYKKEVKIIKSKNGIKLKSRKLISTKNRK